MLSTYDPQGGESWEMKEVLSWFSAVSWIRTLLEDSGDARTCRKNKNKNGNLVTSACWLRKCFCARVVAGSEDPEF